MISLLSKISLPVSSTVNKEAQAIAVVHRSDGSGATFVFTNYLSKMGVDWRTKVGSITSVEWPIAATNLVAGTAVLMRSIGRKPGHGALVPASSRPHGS